MKTKRLFAGVLVIFGIVMTSTGAAGAADANGNGNWTSAGSDSWTTKTPALENSEDAAVIAALAQVQAAVHNLQPEAHCPGYAPARRPSALVAISQAFNAGSGSSRPRVVRGEIGMGFTQYNQMPNGFWYQQGFPYKLKMAVGEFSVGAVANVGGHFQVHAGFQDLGKVTSSAVATASDANYAQCRDNHSLCWPRSNWYGRGDVVQAYATITHDGKLFGIPVVLEIGAGAYRPSWNETIPNWISNPTAKPQAVSVNHDPRLEFSPKIGYGVRLSKNVTLMLDVEEIAAKGDQYPAVYGDGGPTYTLEVRDQL